MIELTVIVLSVLEHPMFLYLTFLWAHVSTLGSAAAHLRHAKQGGEGNLGGYCKPILDKPRLSIWFVLVFVYKQPVTALFRLFRADHRTVVSNPPMVSYGLWRRE
jgi:hypothetical protein